MTRNSGPKIAQSLHQRDVKFCPVGNHYLTSPSPLTLCHPEIFDMNKFPSSPCKSDSLFLHICDGAHWESCCAQMCQRKNHFHIRVLPTDRHFQSPTPPSNYKPFAPSSKHLVPCPEPFEPTFSHPSARYTARSKTHTQSYDY